MDLISSKVIVLILFGLLKFITGLAPSFILRRLKVHGKRKVWLEKAMGAVLCVGGGVLLATVFVHMLPEVRETLETAKTQFKSENAKTKSDSHQEPEEHSHEHGSHDDHEDDHGYPFAELLTCAGFFVIYMVEAIVHRVFMGVHGANSGHHGHSHAIPSGMLKQDHVSDRGNNDADNESGSGKYAISTPTSDSGVDNPAFKIENDGSGHGELQETISNGTSTNEQNGAIKHVLNETPPNNGIRLTSPTNDPSELDHPDAAVWTKSPFSKKYKTHSVDSSKDLNGLAGRSNVYNVSSATLTSYTTYNSEGGDHSFDEASLPNHYGLPAVIVEDGSGDGKSRTEPFDGDRERKVLFSVRNFLIVLALSVHSIFEGMAIGLQLEVQDVWKLFLAVSLHDVPVHFCVGMEMFNGGIKKLHIIIYFLILGIITPVGVIIGIVVTEHAGEGGNGMQTLIIGLLQGLAGGTLLYITFYEVLDRDKLSKAGMTGITGCALLICGFAFMAALEAAGGHSHGVIEKKHDHGNDRSSEHHFGTDNHHGHSHEDGHENHMKTLSDAIHKYNPHNDTHDTTNSHHGHHPNEIENSDHWDLESEINGINAELEHDENEHEEDHHHDAHRQSQSHVEGHAHIHNEGDDHIHDQHHQNEKDAPKDVQNSDKSMFLTLQKGTE